MKVQPNYSRRVMALILIVLVCLIFDQSSKYYAESHWVGEPTQSYLGDFFRIQHARNPGGFLSLGGSLDATTRFWILTVANGMLIGSATIFILVKKKITTALWFSIALIVAGGVGNLIDRIRLNGEVIDFLNLGIGSLRTGIFNIADIAITAGELMLFWLLWRYSDDEESDVQNEQETTQADLKVAPKENAA